MDVIEQYVDLVSGCWKLRDALKEHAADANMLDIRNVIWTHETLCESGNEEGNGREEKRDEKRSRRETVDQRQTTEPSREEIEKPPRAAEIAEQLEAVGQVILYGPPGTGKTWTALRFAEWWVERSDQHRVGNVETVTFHPSFSYEDFVEGLTATIDDTGHVGYEYRKGIFADFVSRARKEHESTPKNEISPRYILIIDEINRGKVANVFGELITCLEREHPGNERSIRLAHSQTLFSVPPNVYLIGTMNTADRSIGLIDAALRRRFRFLAFSPDYDLLCERIGISQNRLHAVINDSEESYLYIRSILALKAINENLRADVERGKQIGHTYLLTATDTSELVNVWRYELLPLLEEYYYTHLDRLRKRVFGGQGDRLFDWNTGQIRQFDAEDLRVTLDDLIESSSTVTADTIATTSHR